MKPELLFSDKVDVILPKLAKLKKELQAVTKSANNPFFKSKYADLNTYLDEVEPRLESFGMVLLQPTSVDFLGNNVVSSIIVDVDSGQFYKASMKLVGDNDMQKAGGGVTYGRRYTLGSMLSMQAEDDDGNTASGKVKKDQPKQKAEESGTSKSNVKQPDSGFRKRKDPAPSKPTSGGDNW